MIKLKDILLESTAPDIFVPRRIENRLERMIALYVRNGSKGNLSLKHLNLTKLPEILKDITVGGNFTCYNNFLTSLEGAPKVVDGSFDCGDNKLTSLDGAPEYIKGYFNCSHNKLTSLDGAPKTVDGKFTCYNNFLTSLEGAPSSVGRDFYCSENRLTSLDGVPKTVGGDFLCFNNPVKFTEEQVRAVCDVKGKILV